MYDALRWITPSSPLWRRHVAAPPRCRVVLVAALSRRAKAGRLRCGAESSPTPARQVRRWGHVQT
eukprot:gene9192-4441_t